ncbi:MAG: PEP-CTERM sorting domain-containing protein, partial [Limisphaerales bacterium]
FIGEANPADLNPDGTLITGRDPQWVYVYNETGTLTVTPVPEPATLGLLSAGLLGLLAFRRRKA